MIAYLLIAAVALTFVVGLFHVIGLRCVEGLLGEIGRRQSVSNEDMDTIRHRLFDGIWRQRYMVYLGALYLFARTFFVSREDVERLLPTAAQLLAPAALAVLRHKHDDAEVIEEAVQDALPTQEEAVVAGARRAHIDRLRQEPDLDNLYERFAVGDIAILFLFYVDERCKPEMVTFVQDDDAPIQPSTASWDALLSKSEHLTKVLLATRERWEANRKETV